MLNLDRVLRKTLSVVALAGLCLSGVACGGEDESLQAMAVGTEVALVPAVPVLTSGAQMTNGGLTPQRGMLQREAAQDISPDPIPARDSSVNAGTGSESTGGSSSSETQGTTKR